MNKTEKAPTMRAVKKLIPAKLTAEITGLSEDTVRSVRSGRRGKGQDHGATKIKVVDRALAEKFGIAIEEVKKNSVLDLPIKRGQAKKKVA